MAVWTPSSSATTSRGQTRQKNPISTVVALSGNQFWVLHRRRLGGVICFASLVLLTLISIHRLFFLYWVGSDEGGMGTDTARMPETVRT